jgi:hypothetical protein
LCLRHKLPGRRFLQVAANGSAQPLAEHWTGGTWTIEPALRQPVHTLERQHLDDPACPNPATPQSGFLTGLWGVSCPAASSCTAAATFAPTNFTASAAAEYWNGTAWKIQATAQPTAGKHLVAVSCVSAHICTAVGGTFTKGTVRKLQLPLAERE